MSDAPQPETRLTVVIPALNARPGLQQVIRAFKREDSPVSRIIIADGGSDDGTDQLAGECLEQGLPVSLITAPRGRGPQLRAGAEQAESDWLLFWHADTLPAGDWMAALTSFMATARPGEAGHFRLRLDDGAPAARRVERLANWRSRTFGLPYGDQGLLIRRADYEAIGGYRPLPLMEDVDIVRRIGRVNMRELPADAVTSAERYQRDGYWFRPLRNLFCLALYLLGVRPERIARLYS
jgi:rSAM/selenodomain-associated transferase 2